MKDKKNSESESKSKPESKSKTLVGAISDSGSLDFAHNQPFAPKHRDRVVDVKVSECAAPLILSIDCGKGRVYRVRANCAACPRLHVLTEVHKHPGPYIRRFCQLVMPQVANAQTATLPLLKSLPPPPLRFPPLLRPPPLKFLPTTCGRNNTVIRKSKRKGY
ncbi:hypothetical protein M378DRAFT_399335 [Amanita muscaria Koide BX008]|uniref:Uncharacterized protein n=1 Tax=Amanita muscaria (strain Koide BX008) TaxID=946122 RepID=A0A0C2ST32_AMAMK|nr:hypothetical protein M378DRAFT_399335 [Amanita muscaria Koide BX008]